MRRITDSTDREPGRPKVDSITVTSQSIRPDGTWKVHYRRTIRGGGA